MRRIIMFMTVVSVLFLSACTFPEETKVNTVFFNTYGGTAIEDVDVENGDTILEPTIPIKDGYIFQGWFSDSQFHNAYDFSNPVAGDLSLHAKWEPILYNLTMHYYDDFSDVLELEINQEIILDQPTRDGYEFLGWYIDEDYSEQFEEQFMLGVDLDIYALWEEAQYTLSVYANGILSTEFEVPFGTPLDFEDVVLDTYVFEGWFTDDTYTELFGFSTMPNHDVSIYAYLTKECDEGFVPNEFDECEQEIIICEDNYIYHNYNCVLDPLYVMQEKLSGTGEYLTEYDITWENEDVFYIGLWNASAEPMHLVLGIRTFGFIDTIEYYIAISFDSGGIDAFYVLDHNETVGLGDIISSNEFAEMITSLHYSQNIEIDSYAGATYTVSAINESIQNINSLYQVIFDEIRSVQCDEGYQYSNGECLLVGPVIPNVSEGQIDIVMWSGSGIRYENFGHMNLSAEELTSQMDAAFYATAKAFNEIYPNVVINYTGYIGGPNDGGRVWSEVLDEYEHQYGVYPTIYAVDNLATYIDRGLAADLSVFSQDPLYQDLNPTIMNMMNFEGRQFGLPFYSMPWGIYVNKELAENNNLSIPTPDWTIDEYTDFISNSQPNEFYGSMDAPIRIIETGTNTVMKKLYSYNQNQDYFVDLDSNEVRSMIPYLNLWYEHSVWGNYGEGKEITETFFNQTGGWGGWGYSRFMLGSLLTLEGDPWMLSDCANQRADWWGRCQSSDWDYYPRPSTDYTDNTIGLVLDPISIYNHCKEDGNASCNNEELEKMTLSYMFSSFFVADNRAFDARASQLFYNHNFYDTATLNSLPVTTGLAFEEQMEHWFSRESHQLLSDPYSKPGFHEVLRIYESGQFWDVSEKAFPMLYMHEGQMRNNLFEWKQYWNPEINGGASIGDSEYIDTILMQLQYWNDASNDRFTTSYQNLLDAIDYYYTSNNNTVYLTYYFEEDLELNIGDAFNPLQDVTVMGSNGVDYTEGLFYIETTCDTVGGEVVLYTTGTCEVYYGVYVEGKLHTKTRMLYFKELIIDVDPNAPIMKQWDFENTEQLAGWGVFGNVDFHIENNTLAAFVESGINSWEPRLNTPTLQFLKGEKVRVSFMAKADVPYKAMKVQIGEILNVPPWFTDFMPSKPHYIELTNEWQEFEITFEMPFNNDNGSILFEMGDIFTSDSKLPDSVGIDAVIYLDNLTVQKETIVDVTPPVFHGLEDVVIFVEDNVMFDPLLGVTASDDELGDITADIIVLDYELNTSYPGVYEIQYLVSDGVHEVFATRTITVLYDQESPVFIDDFGALILLVASEYNLYDGLRVVDNRDGDLTANITIEDDGGFDINTVGEYYVKYGVFDDAGNISFYIRLVVVKAITETDLVLNGDFEEDSTWQTFVDSSGWSGLSAEAYLSIDDGQATYDVLQAGGAHWAVSMYQSLQLEPGKSYQVSFDAKVDYSRTIDVHVGYIDENDYYITYGSEMELMIFKEYQTYQFIITVHDDYTGEVDLKFDIGAYTGQFQVDNIRLEEWDGTGVVENTNLVKDGTFDTVPTHPWDSYVASWIGLYGSFNIEYGVGIFRFSDDGHCDYCAIVYQEVHFEEGVTYKVTFDAKSQYADEIQVNIWNETDSINTKSELMSLDTNWRTYEFTFTYSHSTSSLLQFQIGALDNEDDGVMSPNILYLDNVKVEIITP